LLEEENRKLKQLVADLNLDKHILQDVLAKKLWRLGVDRSSVRYVSHRPDQAPLMLRIRDLAATRTRYDYFRTYILLRREDGS
jgi:hypothetical protein